MTELVRGGWARARRRYCRVASSCVARLVGWPPKMAGFSSAASESITASHPVAARQRSMSSGRSIPPFATTGMASAALTARIDSHEHSTLHFCSRVRPAHRRRDAAASCEDRGGGYGQGVCSGGLRLKEGFGVGGEAGASSPCRVITEAPAACSRTASATVCSSDGSSRILTSTWYKRWGRMRMRVGGRGEHAGQGEGVGRG